MKPKKHIAIVIIALIMTFLALPTVSFADASTGSSVDAEIMTVYGGADGIISMTFDDGYYNTALVLNELLAKYDLKASIMVIADRTHKGYGEYMSSSAALDIFSAGYLEPQSHSMTHISLKDGEVPNDQKAETYKTEIADSKTLVETMFPDSDILTFAIPYGSMADDAYDFASEYYYAIRTTNNGVQTLDPGFTSTNGSWSRMYSPGTGRLRYTVGNYTDAQQIEMIKSDIDSAANGWYIPITHRVGDVDDVRGEDGHIEMTYAVADEMFAYIASLRDEGKVWVTTYSEAVKYVRERQNSTVNAYSENGAIFVDLTMSDFTEDGLSLDADVFNTPLTVKVEVPATYGTVFYTTGTKQYIAEAFNDDGKNCVYVNLIPNEGPVEIRVNSTHSFGDWDKYDEDLHERACIDCGVLDYGEHEWDEGEITEEPTHTETGTKMCTCIHCGEKKSFPADTTDEHTFSEKNTARRYRVAEATCTTGTVYYYVCLCGEAGTKTYEADDALGHAFGQWRVELAATEKTDGRSVRVCECGEKEYEVIPATGGADSNGISTPLLIGIIGGALLLSLGITVTLLILKKKRS